MNTYEKCGASFEEKVCLNCSTDEEKEREEKNNKNLKESVCRKCGKVLDEKVKFCPNCGTEVKVEEELLDPICRKCRTVLSDDVKFCPNCGTARKLKKENLEITEEDIKEHKNLAILCYLGIFMLIPFLTKPNSGFIKYHFNQGLLLFILSIISSFIMVIPILGWIFGLIGLITSFVFFIMGIINVIKGRVKPLPIIGKYKLIK